MTDFFRSWKSVAIYLICVIWTPILAIDSMPPFRLDDIWLIVWAIGSFSGRIPAVKGRSLSVLVWLFLLISCATAVAVFVNWAISKKPIEISQAYTVGIFLRYALVAWIINGIALEPYLVRRICTSFCIAMNLSALIVLAQVFGIQPWDSKSIALWTSSDSYYLSELSVRGGIDRAVGTIGNPNFLGEFFCVNFAGGIYLLLTSSKLTRWPAWVVGVVSFGLSAYIVVYGSSSRTAMVCLLLILVGFLSGFMWLTRRSLNLFLIILALITAFGLASVVFRTEIPERIRLFLDVESAAEVGLNDDLMGMRFEMWRERLTFLLENPLMLAFGLGLSSHDLLISDNGYLRAFLQSGVLGGSCVIGFWGYVFVRGMRSVFFTRTDSMHRLQVLYVFVSFTNFMIFEFTADGLVQAKLGCLITIMATLLVKISSGTNSVKLVPSRTAIVAEPQR